MKRFFASDAESDMLIAEATKTFGLKIGDIINMAIKNQFLPITEPFRTEARFILQRHTEGALEAQEIKQSMTRGIRALGTRPVRDADRLQGFFARYHLHEDVENRTITENDALWESAVEVYNILGKQISVGGINKWKIYGLGCNFPQYSLFNSMIFHEMNNIEQYKMRDLAFLKWKV